MQITPVILSGLSVKFLCLLSSKNILNSIHPHWQQYNVSRSYFVLRGIVICNDDYVV